MSCSLLSIWSAALLSTQNVQATSRVKVPFGIAQVGKAFRNEITPRNFIFRSREFEQMEIGACQASQPGLGHAPCHACPSDTDDDDDDTAR